MTAPSLLQLRIELLDIQPLIWRRLQIPDDYTFWDLHVAIQSAFAWNDSHLHAFRVSGRDVGELYLGIPIDDFGSGLPTVPSWERRVAEILTPAHPCVDYEYDFGDSWKHAIVLEDIVAAAPGKKYPRCTAGERAGPPDDCGGSHGYAALLEALANPDEEDYAASHVWATSQKGKRGLFDPEAFDEQQVKFANPAPRLRRLKAHFGLRD